MSSATLKNIIQQVKRNPKLGIAVKNNEKNNWVYKMTTFQKMKDMGFHSVESFLNNLYDTHYNDITIYLKRSNGTSSTYVKDQKVDLKNNNARQAQPQYNTNNTVASNNTMGFGENNNGFGMAGGLNMPMMNMYSKSQAYDDIKPKYEALLKEVESKNQELQNLKLEKLLLDRDLQTSKEPKKPIISDEVASLLLKVGPELLTKIPGKGLNGAQAQIQQNYSESKNKLLDIITHENFNDDYCSLFSNVIDKLIAKPESAKELFNYINQEQNATNTN